LLNWAPELDDLEAIVRHALAWEGQLMAETGLARAMPRDPVSA
jgi:UDP-glucose 4-epimerase